MRLSLEITISWEPSSLTSRGGRADDAVMAWRASVLPGSENRAKAHEGSPGTWETLSVSLVNFRPGYRQTNSRPPRPASRPTGANTGRKRWYRQAKATKRGGKGGRESERLIVPSKRGNRPEGTPGREGGAVSGTVGGKHGGCIETRGPCQRNNNG